MQWKPEVTVYEMKPLKHILKLIFEVFPWRPEITPIKTKKFQHVFIFTASHKVYLFKSLPFLRSRVVKIFCHRTGNGRTEVFKENKGYYFLTFDIISLLLILLNNLTKNFKEKQLNLETTWIVWTLSVRIGNDGWQNESR